jgi:hypothetical protein
MALLSKKGDGFIFLDFSRKRGQVMALSACQDWQWAEHNIVHLPGLEVPLKDTTAAGYTFVGYLAGALVA